MEKQEIHIDDDRYKRVVINANFKNGVKELSKSENDKMYQVTSTEMI